VEKHTGIQANQKKVRKENSQKKDQIRKQLDFWGIWRWTSFCVRQTKTLFYSFS